MSDSTVAEQEIREASAPPEALAEHTSSAEAAAQPQQRSLGRSLRAAEAGPAGLWRSLTATGMAGECLSLEDALSYVKAVKERVSPEEYAHFLRAVKEYQSGSLTSPEVQNKITALFVAHLDLLLGFAVFLPQGYGLAQSQWAGALAACTPTGFGASAHQAVPRSGRAARAVQDA